jgi:AcrR family transcriptional regulator
MAEMREPVKRRYNSATRQEQAAGTRRNVLAAAAKVFAVRGYGRTTMESIAAAAGVGVATVYANFGTKAAIVAALIDQFTGDPRLDAKLTVAETTRARVIRRGAVTMRQLHERSAALTDLLRSSRGHEPALEALWRRWQAQHLAAVRQVARELAKRRMLRRGLGVNEAADILYTLAGAETYRELVGERGWSPRRYQAWLEEAGERLLLASLAASSSPTAARGRKAPSRPQSRAPH